jgi:hypothetical protein
MNAGPTVIAEPLTPLGRDRKVFTENGKPWRYKGVTAFPLIDHYARGESIDPFLDAFKGYNTLRCFDYVPSPTLGDAVESRADSRRARVPALRRRSWGLARGAGDAHRRQSGPRRAGAGAH